ncbi:exonuclease subunit SbcD, partial [Acinetobacter baumannii]
QFLAWLLDRLAAEGVDALLVTGDVFDNQNPPAAAQALVYDFLVAAHRRLPRLQVVVIGGNHDSGHRLEAPAGLMRGVRAHVVGTLPRDSQGR